MSAGWGYPNEVGSRRQTMNLLLFLDGIAYLKSSFRAFLSRRVHLDITPESSLGFKHPQLKDRRLAADEAKKAMLEKFRAALQDPAMEEQRAVQQRTHSEVEAVCADSSLTAQQRQQKIREIHEQSKQQLDALISPEQRQSLKSCQASRNHGGTGAHRPEDKGEDQLHPL